MQARDVMTTNVISVTPDTGVPEIAKKLLEGRISGVPVIDKDEGLVGIVSESDLMRRPELETERRPSWWLSMLTTHEVKTEDYIKSHGRCAMHVMSRNVISVQEDTSLEQVADTLQRHRVKRVPVVRDGKVVGIVARSDLLHGLLARQTGHAPTPDDETMKTGFRRELAQADVETKGLNYVVTGGVVHVWGMVMSARDKDAIRIAARSVPGVKDVSMHVDLLPRLSLVE